MEEFALRWEIEDGDFGWGRAHVVCVAKLNFVAASIRKFLLFLLLISTRLALYTMSTTVYGTLSGK